MDFLREQESGVISEMVGCEQQIHRLKELGLFEGVRITIVKCGEPCLIAIQDQRLSLRLDPSLIILVDVE